jgi:hypothetical protein
MTMRPNISTTDISTGIQETREMTENEYADLLDSGWTMEGNDEALTSNADSGTSAE